VEGAKKAKKWKRRKRICGVGAINNMKKGNGNKETRKRRVMGKDNEEG
jgi:hypothetical protein